MKTFLIFFMADNVNFSDIMMVAFSIELWMGPSYKFWKYLSKGIKYCTIVGEHPSGGHIVLIPVFLRMADLFLINMSSLLYMLILAGW